MDFIFGWKSWETCAHRRLFFLFFFTGTIQLGLHFCNLWSIFFFFFSSVDSLKNVTVDLHHQSVHNMLYLLPPHSETRCQEGELRIRPYTASCLPFPCIFKLNKLQSSCTVCYWKSCLVTKTLKFAKQIERIPESTVSKSIVVAVGANRIYWFYCWSFETAVISQAGSVFFHPETQLMKDNLDFFAFMVKYVIM